MAHLKLQRHKANPILEPSKNWWENKAVFNPGATIYKDNIVLLYRAIGDDNISRFGYAESKDGVNFTRFDLPRYDPPINDLYERIGAEDPRITKINEQYYILYTAASLYPVNKRISKKITKISISKEAPFRVRAGLAISKDFKKIQHKGHLFGQLDTKDAAAFPQRFDHHFYILHRVHPNLSISTSPDCINCRHDMMIAGPRKNFWDSQKIGSGAQPIKTSLGWLLFYHGVDKRSRYHLGIMMLDLKNPRKVLYRSSQPILSPETRYEKQGNVKNVVFTCGALRWKDDYYVYYGAADKVIGLATIGVKELEAAIKKEMKGLDP